MEEEEERNEAVWDQRLIRFYDEGRKKKKKRLVWVPPSPLSLRSQSLLPFLSFHVDAFRRERRGERKR